jgi:teichuronic acid biosynthesis glycosyltransferase TuaC
MRVLCLTTSYPQDGDPMSGIFVKTNAEALARHGVEVIVVAPVPYVPYGFEHLSEKWEKYRNTPRYYELGGIPVHRPRYLQLPLGDHWTMAHCAYSRAINSCCTPRPDFIHGHFAYPPGLAAVNWSKRNGVPSCLTLHGDDVNTYPYVNRLCRRRFATACHEVDVLLAVSSALASRTGQLIGKQPQLLPIGVNRRLFSDLPDKATARSILRLPPDGPLVVYVGSLLASKGLRELIEAFTVLAEDGIRGVLVGDGPLRAQADQCPNVTLAGLCDNPRVLLHMRAADVVVLPTYNEGMPTVLIEAGWVGVPVVASAVGGIPELLSGDRGLLIEPKKPDQIIQGIRKVFANPEHAHQRAECLRRHVQTEYDADDNARKLMEMYRRVICRQSC